MHVFISGTDTNIGKTMCSAWLCAHTQYAYYKPIQTGIEDEIDSHTIQTLSPHTKIIQETYALPRPLSPHLSARYAQTKIDIAQISLPQNKKVIIEGAGGLMVPINEEMLMVDLIENLSIPVILVASTKLGTINHTLLSIHALRQRNIPLLGIIMNGHANQDNLEAIQYYGQTTVLAHLPWLDSLSKEQLQCIPLPHSLKNLLEPSS